MAVIKCKMCGGNLEITEGMTVAECEYCGSTQTVPSIDSEKKIKLFERANKLRSACEFDKAYGVYESIVAEYVEEAEAYWGLLLCKYGIEYVDDPKDGKKVPTCHRSSYDSVMDDENLELAMENTDAIARQVYREEAKQIEELRKGIIEVSTKEEPYDIFICYKETDENGERTLDSVLAQDVYSALTEKGYRVFFSRITLEDKLGVEYEPYIFAALNSAKIMLAFGTNYEHYNAVWVKNEWSRFLQIMENDAEKYLIPCYKDIDAYDIPKEFTKLQAQDLGKVGAIQDLVRGIDKLSGKKEKAKENGKVKYTVENKINNLLKRGFEETINENWEEAKNKFEDVLTIDGEHARAYIGLFMVKYHLKEETDILKKGIEMLKAEEINIYETEQYIKKAYQYGNPEYKKIMENWRIDIKLNVRYETVLEEFQEIITEIEQIVKHKEEIVQKKEIGELNKLDKLTEDFIRLEKEFEELGDFKDSKNLLEKCKGQRGKCFNTKEHISERLKISERYQKDVDDFVRNADEIPEVKKKFDELKTIYSKAPYRYPYKYDSGDIHFGTLFLIIIQMIYLVPYTIFDPDSGMPIPILLEALVITVLWSGYMFVKNEEAIGWILFLFQFIFAGEFIGRQIVIHNNGMLEDLITLSKKVNISKEELIIIIDHLWMFFAGLAIVYLLKEILRIKRHNKKVMRAWTQERNAENLANAIKAIWKEEYIKLCKKHSKLGTLRKDEKEVLAGNYQRLNNYIGKIKTGK